MREVNRSSMIVTAKQPFLNWLVSIDAKDKRLSLGDVNGEPVIYLIAECESDEEFQEWLKGNYRTVFEEQLDGWWAGLRFGDTSFTKPRFIRDSASRTAAGRKIFRYSFAVNSGDFPAAANSSTSLTAIRVPLKVRRPR
jgi:hypothetical protein